jgi:spermidine/putrescine transport system ATP-binding protein
VSFEVEPGSFFSLLGPSGCGKTTILRAIAGFAVPDSGDIWIRETRVNSVPPYRRDCAMVFQSYALFPHLTVFDNIAFGLRYKKVPRREHTAMVADALDRVRLSGHERRYPSQLSGGQQQRVALARAIVTKPALLLLDEPLSNLDLRLRQQMRRELRAIQKDVQVTTIYVTHDQAEAFSMSDKIAVMNAGKIEQLGSPSDVYFRPRTEFVLSFIGDANRFVGTVAGHERGDLIVRTDENLEFRVRPLEGLEQHPVGARRALFFREEQVQVGSSPGGDNSFPAVVESVQNLGSMVTYTLRLRNGSEVRAIAASSRAHAPNTGLELFVAVDPADCILIAQ